MNRTITEGELLDEARRVLQEESDALAALRERLDTRFVGAIDLILACKTGRVVVTGMGKSGSVGRKIAATLASTGTPSLFLHPGEALHGDLGMVTGEDIVLALSYSGETDELLAVLPILKQRAKSLIAVTGRGGDSTLAQSADIWLDVRVEKEACPHNLAPTTSTTLMIALGDALAVALMRARDFGAEDYARLHPGGSLGRRLLLRVRDVMRHGDALAVVQQDISLHDALFAITKAQAGAACVVDSDQRIAGILTDGDIRRFLLAEGADALRHPVADAMNHNPRTTSPDNLAYDTLAVFERPGNRFIGDLPVIDSEGRPVGLLMLKDLVRVGLASIGSGEQENNAR